MYLYASSFFSLNILFKIPRKNFGAFTTTIFIFVPPLYFFTIMQTPAPIRQIPSKVIRMYLGMVYARNNPVPIAIKKYPALQFECLRQHFRLLITPSTSSLLSLYSFCRIWLPKHFAPFLSCIF